MKKLATLILLAISLTACGNSSQVASKSYVAGNGTVTYIDTRDRKEGPTFSGLTLDGENFELPHGGIVVINVWASWCAPCRAEVPTLIALSQRYPEVQFMGILTRDNLANAEVFAKQLAVPYPNFIDDALILGFRDSLPANAIPTTLVIDKSGKVAARVSGPVSVAGLSELIDRLNAE